MKKLHKKTITSKLTLRILLIGLIPMLCISLFQYYYSTQLLIDEEKKAIEISTEGIATGMDEWLQGKFEEVLLASQFDEITQLDQAKQLEMAKRVKALDEAYEAVVFIDTNGIVRAHTTEKQINVQSLQERAYFQDGLKGQTTITEVLVSNVSGNRMITLSTPVYSKTQEIIGVFIATVNFERLSNKYLAQADEGRSFIIVDSNGVIQAHPNEELINVPLADAGLENEWTTYLSSAVNSSDVQEMKLNGENVIIASTNITVPGYTLHTIVTEKSILTVVNLLKYASIIMLVVAAAIIIAIGIYQARRISRPIVRITKQVEEIATGNLLIEPLSISSNDEIGQLEGNINKMHSQLSSIIQNVNTQALHVAHAASELEMATDQPNDSTLHISNVVEEFGSGAQKQLMYIEQTTAATDELSSRMDFIAEEAEATSTLSRQAFEKASDGNDKLQMTVSQMESIADTITALHQSMREMEQRSNEIDQVVDVISAIADQTSLLSLNASIEAARVGEHGKGFSIVADEVRSLAEQSAQSTQQINELIENIQHATKEAIQLMEKSQQEVVHGVYVAQETGKLFSEIRHELKTVVDKTIEVSRFANEMESNTHAVSDTMHDIMLVSKETLSGTQTVIQRIELQMASIEEFTNSTQKLSDMADNLHEVVNQFKVVKPV
ncbi:MAG: methyl-accepting chemotaxis protein [Caryophanon sp.]|nr:methyl-accepting chemotaxis protein [Caryophanon sp.]